MILDDLKTYEPIIYQMIENALANNRLSHFYLLAGPINNLKLDTAYLLAQYMIKNQFDEELYLRIKDNNYYDVRLFDGTKEKLGVDILDDLDELMDFTGLESKNKVAIFNDINQATNATLNKLLKEIEEPNSHNYYIMITNNIDSLLDTIKSRATVLYFHKPINKQLYDLFINKDYSSLDSYLLSNFLSNTDVDDSLYNQAKDCVFETISYLNDIDYLEIYYQNEIYQANYFKDKSKLFLMYYLNLLSIYLNDALDNNFNDEEYNERLNILKEYNIVAILEVVLDILRKNSYNYDRKLLMDELAYRLNIAIKGE